MALHRVMTFAGSVLALGLLGTSAWGQNKSFGGPEESFKGKGDREPPICLLDAPRLAGENFHVMWDCRDNDAKREDIRTELWLQPAGAPIFSMVGTFIGFPASVQVTSEIVNKENFREAFPIRVKLLARDTAGNATVSPVRTIEYANTKLRSCDLLISSEGSTSTIAQDGTDTTDTTSSGDVFVDVKQIPVSASTTASTVDVSTFEPTLASKCELEQVCSNDEKVSIRLSLTKKSTSSTTDSSAASDATNGDTATTNENATGSLDVTPGASGIAVSGEVSGDASDVDAISVSGTAQIGGHATQVEVTCR